MLPRNVILFYSTEILACIADLYVQEVIIFVE